MRTTILFMGIFALRQINICNTASLHVLGDNALHWRSAQRRAKERCEMPEEGDGRFRSIREQLPGELLT
jgi:hypothetical protein